MNHIQSIQPYRLKSGLWAFDDARKGLEQELFVPSASHTIDAALEVLGFPNGTEEFVLIFSAGEFPGYQFKAELTGPAFDGHMYKTQVGDVLFELWLCPALMQYFDEAPDNIRFQIIEFTDPNLPF